MTESQRDPGQSDSDDPSGDTMEATLADDAEQLRQDSVKLGSLVTSLLPADVLAALAGAPDATLPGMVLDSSEADALVIETSRRLRATDAKLATLRTHARKA